MIHGRFIGQGEDISEVKNIREEIFRKGEEADLFKDYDLRDEEDPMALNAILDEDGAYVGSGRLILDLIEDRFYVDDICIKKEHRGKKYGDFLVRILAEKALQCGADCIYAEVPAFAAGFFEKMFFKPVRAGSASGLMKADIESFQGCCHSGSEQASAAAPLGACGKEGGCAGCSGCGSSLKQSVLPGEERRYR